MKDLFYVLLMCFSIHLNAQMENYEKPIISSNYKVKTIVFKFDKLKLEGTLISPKTEYNKLVIIAPGSGKHTRNNHYVLAENLLKQGIVVFRYDERGVGKSEGKYKRNRNINIQDLEAAYNHLRNLDTHSEKQIGILGHSMGGFSAVVVSKKCKGVDFFSINGNTINR